MLWHYTHGMSFPSILTSKVILPCGHRDEYPLLDIERVVWFSKSDTWENTVKKAHPTEGHLMTFGELVRVLGAYRIGVDDSAVPIWFPNYRADHPELGVLAKAAKKWSANPRDWYISKAPVGRAHWKAIEVWDKVCCLDIGGADNSHWVAY